MLGNRYFVENVEEVYSTLGKDLLEFGEITKPRGNETKELISPQIIIRDPRSRLVYNKERKYNIFHAISESIMLHSNSNKAEHIGEFNSNMKLFADDGIHLYGAYGARISDYIKYIVETLDNDKDSRQAALSIYNNKDMVTKTKDVPCTENLQFLIRDNRLHLIVNMRSNDILYGFQFDVVMFTMLQETIANHLEIDMGYYIHNAGSMHVYRDYFNFKGYEMLDNMANNSKAIRVINDGNTYQWKWLADTFTNKEDKSFLLKGFTKELYELIAVERFYREKKKLGSSFNLSSAYESAPDWAKPFLAKWNK